MQRKMMFYQRFCQLNLWSVIIDFSTEHNLPVFTINFISLCFHFFSIWRTAALKCLWTVPILLLIMALYLIEYNVLILHDGNFIMLDDNAPSTKF